VDFALSRPYGSSACGVVDASRKWMFAHLSRKSVVARPNANSFYQKFTLAGFRDVCEILSALHSEGALLDATKNFN